MFKTFFTGKEAKQAIGILQARLEKACKGQTL
jgi:hypothetical protein